MRSHLAFLLLLAAAPCVAMAWPQEAELVAAPPGRTVYLPSISLESDQRSVITATCSNMTERYFDEYGVSDDEYLEYTETSTKVVIAQIGIGRAPSKNPQGAKRWNDCLHTSPTARYNMKYYRVSKPDTTSDTVSSLQDKREQQARTQQIEESLKRINETLLGTSNPKTNP